MADEKEDILSTFGATPLRGEMRPFAREQLVACEKCARSNAPTRMNCLYCGAALPTNEAVASLRRPSLRQLEGWEQGFNVVALPGRAGGGGGATASEAATAEAAALLRLDAGRLREITSAPTPLPLARVASREEAALIEERLRACGFRVETVADEVLSVETKAPVRVRRLEFGDETLTAWGGSGEEAHVLAWADVGLLVSGRLFTKRIEVEERRTRLGMEKEMVNARELTEDAGVLDLFGAASTDETRLACETHWRITSDSFDYSCLGAGKSLLAGKNFVALRERLRARAASAACDEAYVRVRHLLADAWPLAERTESRGLRRERPGKFNVEAATVVTNETQWTRYARLRNYYEGRKEVDRTQ